MRQACSTTHVSLFEHLDIIGNGYQEKEVLSILGRGWTFQERILSRCLLHCSSEEIAWECVSGDTHCECASMVPYTRPNVPRQMHGHLRSIPDTKKLVENRLRNGASEAWDRINSPLREWQDLIVAYSSCQFAYSRDRLVALEGIAQQFQQFRLGSYIYGMWGGNLQFQLDWRLRQCASHEEQIFQRGPGFQSTINAIITITISPHPIRA